MIQVLTRPKALFSCITCKRWFTDQDELTKHLLPEDSGRAVCSVNSIHTAISCLECRCQFKDLQSLILHIQNSSVHNPEVEGKLSGRCVLVGNLSPGTAEKHIKQFFEHKGFTIETTSMLTHVQVKETFASVELCTQAQAVCAVRLLHRRELLHRKITVKLPQQAVSRLNKAMDPSSGNQQAKRPVENYVNLRGGAKIFLPDSVRPVAHIGASKNAPDRLPIVYGGPPARAGLAASPFIPPTHRSLPPLVHAVQYERGPWTSLNNVGLLTAGVALEDHCHREDDLTQHGYHVTKPMMPSHAEMEARVKCKNCRNMRTVNEAKSNKTCSKAPAKTSSHVYNGYAHLAEKILGFEHAPSPSYVKKRHSISLDCEMAGGWARDGPIDNVIQITAVDYVTGETLISNLVEPTHRINQWRSDIHGVRPSDLIHAARAGTTLAGWRGARAALFSLMDTDTILVGHALHNDLNILRIAHSRCVDSEILAANAVDIVSHRQWALKFLCTQLLGLNIQKDTHACLEDTFAAREVVLHMTMRPQAFAVWARGQRATEMKKLEELQALSDSEEEEDNDDDDLLVFEEKGRRKKRSGEKFKKRALPVLYEPGSF